MGRRPYSTRKTTKECYSISMKWLKDNGYLGGLRSGGISWSNCFGEKIASVGFEASARLYSPYMRLWYTHTGVLTNQSENLDYEIKLTPTPCKFGGYRWWFVCPLDINGEACNRRVGVLYLGGKYFGCRHCYNLTYESCRGSVYDSILQLGRMANSTLNKENQ